jgi:hypothetical protein
MKQKFKNKIKKCSLKKGEVEAIFLESGIIEFSKETKANVLTSQVEEE